MRVSDAFPSNYMKAADLKGQTVMLTVDNVTMEDLGGDRKPVLHFTDAKKGLVLNVTNARAIEGTHGDDMDAWSGRKIELFAMAVSFQGRTVDSIRVRPVADINGPHPDDPDATPFDDPIDL
jgi:hypothetical protein